MYPKNAASPPRLSIGPVVQISDGAVQTSGVSISVLPQGGTTAAGGGTTAYENGIVCYTPTQAETNYTAFIVTAYKSGCVPASATVVTTESATAGRVYVATNGDKTGYTASTVSDKTGYSLTATTGLGNQTANITGTVSTVTTLTNLPAVTSNWLTAAGIADGAIDAAALAADVWARLGIVAYGTAQAATGTTLQLASSSAFANGELNGSVIVITGGTTGVGQSRLITGYVGSTDTATVDTWTTTPTGTITYVVFAAAPASSTVVPAVNVTQFGGSAGTFSGGRPEVNTTHAAGTAWGSGAITAASIAADAVDEILDEVVEGTVTVRQALRAVMATLAGKVSGAGTTTMTIRDSGDTKNRFVVTVDADGNRSNFSTFDLT